MKLRCEVKPDKLVVQMQKRRGKGSLVTVGVVEIPRKAAAAEKDVAVEALAAAGLPAPKKTFLGMQGGAQ